MAERLETAETDLRPPLALLAGQDLEFDEDELRGARRRAMFLLAAGGEPERGLILDGRAVTALADELDRPERRKVLGAALVELREPVAGLPRVTAALDELLADDGLAWRALGCALLAEEVG